MTELSNDEIAKRNNHKLDLSNKRFKEVSNSDYKKFEMLPNWLDNVSYRYEEEFQNHFPNRYYHFKRGSIIRVDFGVNMGSEFSFLHFAVVLDKNDNSRNRTLTVVPLTSKNGNNRFPLGKEIFNQTTTILEQRKKDNILKAKLLDEENETLKSGMRDYIKKVIDDLVNRCPNYKTDFSDFYQNKDDFSNIPIAAANVLKISHKNPQAVDIKSFDINLLTQLEKQSERISKEVTKLVEENTELHKVIKIYEEYNKDSFVRLSDITTISKFRIRKINKFDPSGKIRLDDNKMGSISNKLMKLYITR